MTWLTNNSRFQTQKKTLYKFSQSVKRIKNICHCYFHLFHPVEIWIIDFVGQMPLNVEWSFTTLSWKNHRCLNLSSALSASLSKSIKVYFPFISNYCRNEWEVKGGAGDEFVEHLKMELKKLILFGRRTRRLIVEHSLSVVAIALCCFGMEIQMRDSVLIECFLLLLLLPFLFFLFMLRFVFAPSFESSTIFSTVLKLNFFTLLMTDYIWQPHKT